jgi:hypothetical protein
MRIHRENRGGATDYDVKMSDGIGKSVLFDHKCRALPWTQQVYGSPVSVTMSEVFALSQ